MLDPSTSLLLPVVRRNFIRKSFRLGWDPPAVALYQSDILLFRSSRKRAVPASMFARVPLDNAVLAGLGVKQPKRYPLSSIEFLTAKKAGPVVRFNGRADGQKLQFSLPLRECPDFLQALRGLLGYRFECSLTQAELLPGKPFSAWRIAVAFVMLGVFIAAQALLIRARTAEVSMFSAVDLILTVLQPVAQLGTIFSFFYLLKALVDSRYAKRRGREPLRVPVLGWTLRMAGLLALAGMYLFSTEITALLVKPAAGTSLEKHPAGTAMLVNVGHVLMFSSVGLLYIGYRLSLRPGRRANEGNSNRPQTLFLRAFEDDNKYSLNPDTLGARALGLRPFKLLERFGPVAHAYPLRLVRLAFGFAMDSIEEQLAGFFRRRGPFLAVGRPGELLATGGAQRVYLPDQEWQEEVSRLICQSDTVVLQPAETGGVTWEVRETLRHLDPRRLLLCVSHLKEWHGMQRYAEFRRIFFRTTGQALPPTLGTAEFIRFDAYGKPELIYLHSRTPFVWPVLGLGISLPRTLLKFMDDLRQIPAGAVFPSTPPAIPVPSAVARPSGDAVVIPRLPRWWLVLPAVLLWTVIPTFLLSGFHIAKKHHGIYSEMIATGSVIHHGDQADYEWSLGSRWQPLSKAERGSNIDFAARVQLDEESTGFLSVICDPKPGRTGDDNPCRKSMLDILARAGAVPPREISRSHRTIEGRAWLITEFEFLALSKLDLSLDRMHANLNGILVDMNMKPDANERTAGEEAERIERANRERCLIASYSGPEGRFALTLETGEGWLAWLPWERKRLSYIFDGFRLPRFSPEELEIRGTTIADALAAHGKKQFRGLEEGHRMQLGPGWRETKRTDSSAVWKFGLEENIVIFELSYKQRCVPFDGRTIFSQIVFGGKPDFKSLPKCEAERRSVISIRELAPLKQGGRTWCAWEAMEVNSATRFQGRYTADAKGGWFIGGLSRGDDEEGDTLLKRTLDDFLLPDPSQADADFVSVQEGRQLSECLQQPEHTAYQNDTKDYTIKLGPAWAEDEWPDGHMVYAFRGRQDVMIHVFLLPAFTLPASLGPLLQKHFGVKQEDSLPLIASGPTGLGGSSAPASVDFAFPCSHHGRVYAASGRFFPGEEHCLLLVGECAGDTTIPQVDAVRLRDAAFIHFSQSPTEYETHSGNLLPYSLRLAKSWTKVPVKDVPAGYDAVFKHPGAGSLQVEAARGSYDPAVLSQMPDILTQSFAKMNIKVALDGQPRYVAKSGRKWIRFVLKADDGSNAVCSCAITASTFVTMWSAVDAGQMAVAQPLLESVFDSFVWR